MRIRKGEIEVVNSPHSRDYEPRVYIVVLNWNGWADTIACLQSLVALEYDNFAVIVCDNASTDGSAERIAAWASAQSSPHTDDGLFWIAATTRVPRDLSRALAGVHKGMYLLRNDMNLGFAGGNNTGLRFALECADMDYAWILNNDTVVARDSLTQLVERIRADPSAGICGSTLLEYDEPRRIQARGARYNRWLARVENFKTPTNPDALVDDDDCTREIDFVVGASLLVSKEFVQQVGLICEDYFLYFEELDWLLRARKTFHMAYASRSFVFHKGGGATKAGEREKSETGEYYGTRARILFTRKFYPYALPTVLFAIAGSALAHFLGGRSKLSRTVFVAALAGLRSRTGPRLKL